MLAKELSKNVFNSKDDAYKSPRFVHNKEMNSIVPKWNITSWEMEEQTTLPPTLKIKWDTCVGLIANV